MTAIVVPCYTISVIIFLTYKTKDYENLDRDF